LLLLFDTTRSHTSKGGLRPTRQPFTPVHRPFAEINHKTRF
jgi:hypothetical protein